MLLSIIKVIIIVLPIVAIILWLISNLYYRKFLKSIYQEDIENNQEIEHDKAGWRVGIRLPFPILRTSKYSSANQIIKKHNNIVKAYWISLSTFLFFTFAFLLFNL